MKKVVASFIFVMALILVIFFLITIQIFNSSTLVTNFKNEVHEKYNVTLVEVDSKDAEQYNSGHFVGPMIAKEGGDPRYYHVYAIKEDGEMKLFIKNEKGCFLPITDMAAQYLATH